MKKEECIQRIYATYLRAQEQVGSGDLQRHPELSREVLQRLAKESGVPTILVTGSRGKGSVAAMTAALLQKKMRVGLFTGPHIYTFNERIRVDGEMISDDDLVCYIKKAFDLFYDMEARLSEGEYISPMAYQAAAALLYYKKRKVDIQIFECGKGVKSDDVGNLPHEMAIMNRIMPEHIPELGATIAEIAAEKAAVMENGCRRCFSARQTAEVCKVLRMKAAEEGVELILAGKTADVRSDAYGTDGTLIVDGRIIKDVHLRLRGACQADNAALALAAALSVRPNLTDKEIHTGLCTVEIAGRLEVISEEPYVLFDACLARESAAEVRRFLTENGITGITLVLALSDDKDYIGVAEEMGAITERIILTTVSNPHYKCSRKQKEYLQARFHYKERAIGIERIPDINDAINAAKEKGAPAIVLALGAARGEIRSDSI